MKLVHRFDTAALISQSEAQPLEELSAKDGCFDKLYQLYDLNKLAADIEVVSFGVSTAVHFTESVWVVSAGKVFIFDSLTGCGHKAVVETKLKPFIEYAISRSPFVVGPVEIILKDSTKGIEAQDAGSNVCAFSSTLCLGKALSSVLSVASEYDPSDDPAAFSSRLCVELMGMKTTARSYEKNRTQAARTLRQLSSQYLLKQAAKKRMREEPKKRMREEPNSKEPNKEEGSSYDSDEDE